MDVAVGLTNCFGIDRLTDLVRFDSEIGARVAISQYQRGSRVARMEVELDDSGLDIHFGLSSKFQIRPSNSLFDECDSRTNAVRYDTLFPDPEGRDSAHGEHTFDVLQQVLVPPFHELACPSYYLPADRAGIMHIYQVLVESLLRHIRYRRGRGKVPYPELSGVIIDYLSTIIGITKRKSQLAELGSAIESEILHGSVQTSWSRVTNMPSHFYQHKHWSTGRKLSLWRTSSMVSELAPLVLYLRHVIEVGDLLVIEEPEAHLHPEMQMAFAVQLARLVNAGVKVMLTTHSDILLMQFLNIMYLSKLDETQRHRVESGHRDLRNIELHPENVGAWRFDPRSHGRGSIVREIRPNFEVGVYPAKHIDTTLKLYDEWRQISNEDQVMVE